MQGEVYQQEGAAGDGGRPRFRGKTGTYETVEWGAGRWERRGGVHVFYYNESAEQLPPRAVNRAAKANQ